MTAARPTLRCLRDDLRLSVPPVTEPLTDLDHVLLNKARAQFAAPDAGHERIRAIDDQVLFKAKVRRWRGAVWIDADDALPWVVAAGQREDGSPDDFYAALATRATAARTRHNAAAFDGDRHRTLVADLLPDTDDRLRQNLEELAAARNRIIATVHDLAAGSLRDGHEHAADYPAFRVGVLVRAEHGHETYAAVRITGSVPADLVAVILRHIPGCDPETWMPELSLPERHLMPAEQAWSTLMDPKAAARLLEERDHED